MRVVILMPVRDDWKSASTLIRQLDSVLSSEACTAEVVIIDDDSSQPLDHTEFQADYAAVKNIRSIRLRLNLGHQRAIAIGLAHIFTMGHNHPVLIMDADGEDTPVGVAQLLQAYRSDGGKLLIFAERSRRTESLLFRCLYEAFKVLHRVLTGLSVRVGNFSIVPPSYLNTLVVQSELWNHYAASVFRSKRPFRMIPIPRGRRIAGTSRMNFAALVTHGLSAISVFGDIVGTRLLIASLVGSILAAGGGMALVLRVLGHHTIPLWAVYTAGALGMIFVQFISLAAIFTFLMLANRTNLGFVPLRDHSLFVAELLDVYPR